MDSSNTQQLLNPVNFSRTPTFWETSIILLKFAVPLMITGFSSYLLYFVNANIVSLRQDATMLGSMGIGDTLYQVVAEGMAYGFSLAFYVQFMPLVAQKQYAQGCRLFYRRSAAAVFASLPLIAFFLLSHRIFTLAGVLPDLTDGAYTYLISLIPAVYLVFLSYTLLMFLSAYNHQNIYISIGIITGALELVLVYFAIITFRGDLYWVGLLVGLYFAVRILVSMLYCKYTLVKEFPESWEWPSWDVFSGIEEEVKHGWGNAFVSLPITMLIEINTVISGGLTNVEAAVQSLIFRLYTLIVYLLDDISFSVISKILFYKSHGNQRLAKLYLNNGLNLLMLVAALLAVFWYGLGESLLTRLVPSGDEYKGPMRSALKYVGLANFLNGLVIHFSKLLRSNEKTLLCALILLFGTCVIQIPFGYLLCFNFNLRLEGIWIAFILTLLFNIVALSYFASKIDDTKIQKTCESPHDIELTEVKKISVFH